MGLGQGFADRVGGPALMAAVEIGEEAADRDGHILARELGGLQLQLLEIARLEGDDLAAMGVVAPADAEAMAPAHQGPGLLPMQIVDAFLVRSRDEGHILEASIGDVDDGGAAALQHRIGGDGGADDEPLDALDPLQPRQPGGDRRGRVARRRGDLGRGDGAAVLIHQDEIREGAAGVDTEDDAHALNPARSVCTRLLPPCGKSVGHALFQGTVTLKF